jgi:hypothetical protein
VLEQPLEQQHAVSPSDHLVAWSDEDFLIRAHVFEITHPDIEDHGERTPDSCSMRHIQSRKIIQSLLIGISTVDLLSSGRFEIKMIALPAPIGVKVIPHHAAVIDEALLEKQ